MIAIILVAVILFIMYKANIEKSNSEFNKRLKGYGEDLEKVDKEAKLPDKSLIEQGGWYCKKCHRTNASYVGTCACGLTKQESLDAAYVLKN